MYDPSYNSVLVQIDDKDAQWGSGNDESMLGKSYNKGKFIKCGDVMETDKYMDVGTVDDELTGLVGKSIMWNEGVEAGTTFDHDGKLYGFIYWWDIRGVLNDK